jgi:hypothetical protein
VSSNEQETERKAMKIQRKHDINALFHDNQQMKERKNADLTLL